MTALTGDQLKFLRELLRWRGVASTHDLGQRAGTLNPASVRQSCKRRGLVTYDGGNDGYWRLTDAGRAALKEVVR